MTLLVHSNSCIPTLVYHQLLTIARGGVLFGIRVIDMRKEAWGYRPAIHKTQHLPLVCLESTLGQNKDNHQSDARLIDQYPC